MSDYSSTILHLRIVVLTLGEKHHACWWQSQFLSTVGLRYLERVYPRTCFSAAVQSAIRVARETHDASIGKGDVFHLFRASSGQELELNRLLLEKSAKLEESYKPILMDRPALMEKLDQIAEGESANGTVGPMQISVESTKRLPTTAAAYLHAFRENSQVFPYFQEVIPS